MQLADLLFQKEVIYAEDVEKIFGKRPWKSRSEEIIEANEKSAPTLDDMPEAVRQAEAEHQRRVAEQQKKGAQGDDSQETDGGEEKRA